MLMKRMTLLIFSSLVSLDCRLSFKSYFPVHYRRQHTAHNHIQTQKPILVRPVCVIMFIFLFIFFFFLYFYYENMKQFNQVIFFYHDSFKALDGNIKFQKQKLTIYDFFLCLLDPYFSFFIFS